MPKDKKSLVVDEDRGMSRWLIAKYLPTSLFSLRMSHSTSSGGKSLYVPTPYSVKLAMIDAAFRAEGKQLAEQIFHWIKGREIRFCPPQHLTVNHTFIKIKREPKVPTADKPYISTIAFREYCFFNGSMDIAIAIGSLQEEAVEKIQYVLAHINYIGKRGSFVQFAGTNIYEQLPTGFTLPVPEALDLIDEKIYKVTQFLDDMGELGAKDLFERINTFSSNKIEVK